MTGCASAEELANLAMGNLPPRKTARVSSHLVGCPQCQALSGQLNDVSTVLQSVHYAAIPENLSARLETALAGESASMVARAPATEAGRRDLPARADRQPRSGRRPWSGWRPSVSRRVALRALAAAGAAVVVLGGGYEAITHLGQPAASSSSSSAAAAPAGGDVNAGRQVSYGHSRSVDAVKSNTDFVPASMQKQVDTALASKRKPANSTFGAPAHAPAAVGTNAVPSQPASAQMDGCVNRLAAGQTVQLVEVARYQGAPAWIIVVTAGPTRPEHVWVVSPSCSATNSHIIASTTLPSR